MHVVCVVLSNGIVSSFESIEDFDDFLLPRLTRSGASCLFCATISLSLSSETRRSFSAA